MSTPNADKTATMSKNSNPAMPGAAGASAPLTSAGAPSSGGAAPHRAASTGPMPSAASSTGAAVDLKSLHPLEIKLLRFAGGAETARTQSGAAGQSGVAQSGGAAGRGGATQSGGAAGRGGAGPAELHAQAAMEALGFGVGQWNQATSWLAAKGLIAEASRTTRVLYELTDFGREQLANGTIDERILNVLGAKGAMRLPELAAALAVDPKEIGSAFGQLSKEGLVAMDEEKRAALKGTGARGAGGEKSGGPSDRMRRTRELLERAASGPLEDAALNAEEREVMGAIAKKRGASASPFRVAERDDVVFALTPAGIEVLRALLEAGMTGEDVGQLTPAMLATGSWKGKRFREYNINTPPVRLVIGRRNPYAEFLQWVKDKLVSLGFEEFDGPLVETEFWNGDALFMPQFHSARDIHDVYYVAEPTTAREIEQPWLDRVAAAHERGGETGSRGWGYRFDRDFTRRLILRSQGTVLSAKQLPKAKIPGKYFGIVRCFRYDQVDATHGADFYQTEGIVLGEHVSLRTLLGLLKMFAEEVAGATEVKYVPGYFPFTEPSVEVHIRHPKLGWFELGGSGIFRPEVTKPLGIEVPVLAWGLGIDRMALMQLGLSDLRELFTGNLENVRLRRRS